MLKVQILGFIKKMKVVIFLNILKRKWNHSFFNKENINIINYIIDKNIYIFYLLK